MIETNDILILSDGTLSSLTNEKNYSQLETIRTDWINWFINSEKDFKCWQDCWLEYQLNKEG